jgi:3'-5' exoribonuclease
MQSIALLKEGDWVEEIYLVTSKQIATARNGVVFLSLKLADKTGEIDGKMWDSAEEAAGTFSRDDFVRIKGVASNYQGAMQIKLKSLARVDDSTVDIANFVQSSTRNPDEMEAELRAAAMSVGNEYLRRIMLAFVDDARLWTVQARAGRQGAAPQLRGRVDRAHSRTRLPLPGRGEAFSRR